MRRCRNRYTSRSQNPTPGGLRVQVPLCAPRRKKPAAFRFRGLRRSRENCISEGSFLLLPIELRSAGDPYTLLAQQAEQQTFNLWVGGPIPPGRTTLEHPPHGSGIPVAKVPGFLRLCFGAPPLPIKAGFDGVPINRCGAIGRRIRFKLG